MGSQGNLRAQFCVYLRFYVSNKQIPQLPEHNVEIYLKLLYSNIHEC